MPHQSKSPKIYILITAVVSFCIIGFISSFLFKKILSELIYFRNRRHLEYLKHENLTLTKQIVKLNNKIRQQEGLLQENQHLRDMLQLKEKRPKKLVATTVISRSPWEWGREILIDKGKDTGIKKGDLVIDSETNLVGKVDRLSKAEAWVRLSSDPNSKIIVNCGDINTILVGALFDGGKLLYVPYDAEIKMKDKVILSDISKKLFTIDVGEVSFISKNAAALTQNIFVKPYANLNNLREVFVIKE